MERSAGYSDIREWPERFDAERAARVERNTKITRCGCDLSGYRFDGFVADGDNDARGVPADVA
jgi:hypothetical protein